MDAYKINTRYAKALFSVALEKEILENVYLDMMLLSVVFKESRQLVSILRNPVIPVTKKTAIITDLFESKVTTLSLDFILFIIKKHREINLYGISCVFVHLYKSFKNIKILRLQTAAPFSQPDKDQLTTLLANFFKSDINVEIEEKIRPEIIGGFCIRFDDYLYDASILSKIGKLKKEFEKNEYEK